VYLELTKMWMKGVAILFAVGAVSGTVLSFELGLLWPGFMQHAGTNQAYAVWYTYDPRETGNTGGNKPLWLVMTGGTWTSPTTMSGTAYVTNGMPFNQSGSNLQITPVGTFTLNFTTASTAQFSYNISAPAGLAPSDPAYNLPPMSGTKYIQRQSF